MHFKYDYSLCKNSPNSEADTHGKLTLKEVWFTYGKNDKGRLSPYVFDYKDDEPLYNPNYNSKETDRWGNYKKHVLNTPENEDFPYTDQNLNTEQREQQAGVWSLHSIKLPSGGVINVTYDKDDYAYVQDKPAMSMMPIKGLSKTDSYTHTPNIYSTSLLGVTHNNRIHLTLPQSCTTSEFKSKYLKGVDWLYYNFLVNINDDADKKEYIGGYARIVNAGIVGGSGTSAYIDMEPVEIGTGPPVAKDRLISPVAKTA
ncbi:MAG: hypothetical protein M0D57_08570 [Sphingobacteriales bacterium JAD_PAG50586_3]|nr:MAG: hypothetical protein M0D57_08570 [Sphingobacteriales bacterium JAD_PAG50586_3]